LKFSNGRSCPSMLYWRNGEVLDVEAPQDAYRGLKRASKLSKPE